MVLGASGKKGHFTENDVAIAKAISNLAVKTIQERKRIEKGIRLKTIGKFAANVVHEIRNPAMAAGGFARRAQKQLENECGHAEELKKYLDIIVDEIRRLENSLN
ncbi:hypothetical protein KKH26_00580, partial [Patescibacteria group bacterium]|nr:hypothetical protein [Patescibacteria group bacterium]